MVTVGCDQPRSSVWPTGRCGFSSKKATNNSCTDVKPIQDVDSQQPWTSTPEQQQALQQLSIRMAAHEATSPSTDTLKWYLRISDFDVSKAEQKLIANLQRRTALRANNLTLGDVEPEFSTGKSYVHDKLDKQGRPVMLVKSSKHITGQFPLEDSKRLCIYTLDKAISKLPVGCDHVIAAIDLKGMGFSNIDVPFMVWLIEAFFEQYPGRMSQVLLVDAPWIFKAPWEVIKPLLRKYQALVRFVSRKELQQEYFTKEALPELFRS